jgi:hypothetical protein
MGKAKRDEINQKRSEYERSRLRLGEELRALEIMHRKDRRTLKSKSQKYERKLNRLGTA